MIASTATPSFAPLAAAADTGMVAPDEPMGFADALGGLAPVVATPAPARLAPSAFAASPAGLAMTTMLALPPTTTGAVPAPIAPSGATPARGTLSADVATVDGPALPAARAVPPEEAVPDEEEASPAMPPDPAAGRAPTLAARPASRAPVRPHPSPPIPEGKGPPTASTDPHTATTPPELQAAAPRATTDDESDRDRASNPDDLATDSSTPATVAGPTAPLPDPPASATIGPSGSAKITAETDAGKPAATLPRAGDGPAMPGATAPRFARAPGFAGDRAVARPIRAVLAPASATDAVPTVAMHPQVPTGESDADGAVVQPPGPTPETRYGTGTDTAGPIVAGIGAAPIAAPAGPAEPARREAPAAANGRTTISAAVAARPARPPAPMIAEDPTRADRGIERPTPDRHDTSPPPAPSSDGPATAPAATVAPPAVAPAGEPRIGPAQDVTAPPETGAPPTVSAHAGRIGHDTGVAIARHVLDNGTDTMTVRLDPKEFGRVEVDLSFDDAGTLRAVIAADNPASLDLLRRDAPELARALSEAGLRADAGTLRFDSRGDGGGNGQSWQRQPLRDRVAADAEDPVDPPAPPAWRPLRTRGRIDLMA